MLGLSIDFAVMSD